MRPILHREIRHPGTILLDEWMKPCEISQNELGRTMGVSPRRINEIVQGKRSITAETALGLEKCLGMSARYWLSLQAEWDLAIALPLHEKNLKRAMRWREEGRPPVPNKLGDWNLANGIKTPREQIPADFGARLPRMPYKKRLPSLSLDPQPDGTMPTPKERLALKR